MIKFKLTSKNGSKYSYEFDTAGLNGIFTVDINTSEVEFTKLDGIFKDNDKAKKDVLYAIYAKLKKENYPESCLYATH
ncbi:MAG: hypothetical protein U0I22_00735 [Treponema sp.]|nr:hypothetical protein [Treponema sp.]